MRPSVPFWRPSIINWLLGARALRVFQPSREVSQGASPCAAWLACFWCYRHIGCMSGKIGRAWLLVACPIIFCYPLYELGSCYRISVLSSVAGRCSLFWDSDNEVSTLKLLSNNCGRANYVLMLHLWMTCFNSIVVHTKISWLNT